MTEDGLIVCKSRAVNVWDDERGRMSEREDPGATVIELLLREPEIVAFLDDYRPEPDDASDDDEPPHAA